MKVAAGPTQISGNGYSGAFPGRLTSASHVKAPRALRQAIAAESSFDGDLFKLEGDLKCAF